jgi:hypothetical protein
MSLIDVQAHFAAGDHAAAPSTRAGSWRSLTTVNAYELLRREK